MSKIDPNEAAVSALHKDLLASNVLAKADRLRCAAAILSNHDSPGSGSRTAGDWSRLHSAIDEYDKAIRVLYRGPTP